ncbi:MAG: hypothetical protein KatS3mg023_3864 [Armatimonadota bacterium]|nr:MAG: hypothetical protein KatS3mg023_3864 [Armatimonadota bacterium]
MRNVYDVINAALWVAETLFDISTDGDVDLTVREFCEQADRCLFDGVSGFAEGRSREAAALASGVIAKAATRAFEIARGARGLAGWEAHSTLHEAVGRVLQAAARSLEEFGRGAEDCPAPFNYTRSWGGVRPMGGYHRVVAGNPRDECKAKWPKF